MRDRRLTYREKVYLLTVLVLPTEQVESRRRPGSKAIDGMGFYSLHVDYLAREMGRREHVVREAREGCIRKGWVSLVHTGTYGRPSCYQMLLGSEPPRE